MDVIVGVSVVGDLRGKISPSNGEGLDTISALFVRRASHNPNPMKTRHVQAASMIPTISMKRPFFGNCATAFMQKAYHEVSKSSNMF